MRVYTEFLGKLDLQRFWVSRARARRSAAVMPHRARASPAGRAARASLAGGDRPVRIEAAYATHELLPLLGVQPLLGRWFDASEDRPGDPTVVVLGYDVWQRAFAGDPAIDRPQDPPRCDAGHGDRRDAARASTSSIARRRGCRRASTSRRRTAAVTTSTSIVRLKHRRVARAAAAASSPRSSVEWGKRRRPAGPTRSTRRITR